jgi:hypothetical protein
MRIQLMAFSSDIFKCLRIENSLSKIGPNVRLHNRDWAKHLFVMPFNVDSKKIPHQPTTYIINKAIPNAMPERPSKKQRREDYRAAVTEANEDASGASAPVLPKKRFYRQRAHANPFSDHLLT